LSTPLKTVSYTVRATDKQSLRWKRAASGPGHLAVGTWLAEAADAYLDGLHRAGQPVPLAWGKGRFKVELPDGAEVELSGWVAPPFGIFVGTAAGPSYPGRHRYTLAYVPAKRLLATLRTAQQCRILAADLARTWVRWNASEPSEDPAPVLDRHQREAL
jgi:hypothetical protein